MKGLCWWPIKCSIGGFPLVFCFYSGLETLREQKQVREIVGFWTLMMHSKFFVYSQVNCFFVLSIHIDIPMEYFWHV